MSDTPVDGTHSYGNSCNATVSSSDNSLEAAGEGLTAPIDCVTETVDFSTQDPLETSEVLTDIPPSHVAQALGGIGEWATLSREALQMPYPHTIMDDLLHTDTLTDELVRSRSFSEEPFSLVNPVGCDDHVPNSIPRFRIRQRADLYQTAHFMLHVITRKMAECSDHIENVCDPKKHRHVETRLNEFLFISILTLAIITLAILGMYGMRLSSALVYFFLMLFAAALAIARLL